MSISMINVSNYNNKLITSLQFKHHLKQFTVLDNQFFNPLSSKQLGASSFRQSRSLQYLNIGKLGQSNKSNRDFAIYSGDPQSDLVSFGPFMVSGKSWIVGALVTVILPFLTNKWGPLLKWTKQLEAAEEKVEEIAEGIEKAAVEVEKIAENLIEKVPKDGKLGNALTFVENAAKQVIKDADIVEDLIHKAEDVEKKLEAMIEDGEDRSKEVAEAVKEVEDIEKNVESMIKDVKAKSKEAAKVVDDNK